MELWKLVNEYKAIAEDEMLDEDSMIGMLTLIGDDIVEKSDNVVKMIMNLTAEAEKFGKVSNEFLEKKTRCEKRAKRLKEYLYNNMNELGVNEIPNELFKIKIQANGGVAPLIIKEGVKIPEEFQKVTTTIDNDKIREALKTQELDFAELGELGTHLVIK